jgi:hypothetical protein
MWNRKRDGEADFAFFVMVYALLAIVMTIHACMKF